MIRRRILGAMVIALALAPVPIARAEPDPGRVKDYQARLLQLGYWLPSVDLPAAGTIDETRATSAETKTALTTGNR